MKFQFIFTDLKQIKIYKFLGNFWYFLWANLLETDNNELEVNNFLWFVHLILKM